VDIGNSFSRLDNEGQFQSDPSPIRRFVWFFRLSAHSLAGGGHLRDFCSLWATLLWRVRYRRSWPWCRTSECGPERAFWNVRSRAALRV